MFLKIQYVMAVKGIKWYKTEELKKKKTSCDVKALQLGGLSDGVKDFSEFIRSSKLSTDSSIGR